MKLTLTTLLLITASTVFSQKTVTEETTPLNSSPLKEAYQVPASDSYEIIASSNKLVVKLTDKDLEKISKARKANEVTYVELNPYVKVKVLPLNTIRVKQPVSLTETK